MKTLICSFVFLSSMLIAGSPAEVVSVTVMNGEQSSTVLGVLPEGTFEIQATIDPSVTDGGNLQAVGSLLLGWPEVGGDPVMRSRETPSIGFEVREGNGVGFWEVWIDGVNETTRDPDPLPPGWAGQVRYQLPNQFRPRDGSYAVRIVVSERETGILLQFFFEHFDRPVAEHLVDHPLAGTTLYALGSLGGQTPDTNTATYSAQMKSLTSQEVNATPAISEIVLQALDLSRPELRPVAEAMAKDDLDEAGRLFLQHLRTRSNPVGPDIETEAADPGYRTVADEVLAGRYGTLGWGAKYADRWTDANGEIHPMILDDGRVNWARENGHLNRHFHWVALAKAYHDTGNSAFAERFSFEVEDWVTREPFYWDRCPQVGNLNLMDGTIFRRGYMNTSNIGRRCELTWWPAYEVFRKTENFDDDAHFAMLLGFLRQSRLLMNPTSFAAHDDGGAHTSMALLQNGLMLPEFKESARWKEVALQQWDEVLKVQFYPDGGHVSGSTGYNWASIKALENFIALMRRSGAEVPARFLETLERGLDHPIALSRPDQGQIDMNDGGWGMVDDHYRRIVDNIFPDHPVFQWMATKGQEGTPPDYRSVYLPNSGHIVQRTGWGEQDKYLFMDAAPMGASHGKNDKLNLYFAIGPHQLISSGGRGGYDANPFNAYTGSTYGYNTILVDDLPQQRVHLKHTHTGHTLEARRWVSNDDYDFGEGFYRSGWYGAEKHVQGVQTRQIVFMKGESPPETGYWIVIDTIEPADDEAHHYKALFHSRRDEAEIDEQLKSFTCVDRGAGYRLLPADSQGLSLRNARGQTSPYIQGWHVVGSNRAPMHTAEYQWEATGATRRVWILEASLLPVAWQVEAVTSKDSAGKLELEVRKLDGGVDRLEVEGWAAKSRLLIRSLNADGSERSQLQIPGSNR